MKRKLLFSALVVAVSFFAGVSCRQTMPDKTVVEVPQMIDEVTVRIVTNAALDEVVAQYDGIKNDYEVDLVNKIVLYHESQRLLSSDYHRHIEARIREVGYDAKIIAAGFNPSPVIHADNGDIRQWPNRFTIRIKVSNMESNTDANRIVDALAYARLGKDSPKVTVHRNSRKLIASYEGMNVSIKSIEQAIACAGFSANDVPANQGRRDAVPHDWLPVDVYAESPR